MLYSADKYGNVYFCDFIPYDVLLLSGGSLKGIYLLGALFALAKHVNCVKTYIGVSSGAIIVFLLSIGFTPYQIFIKLLKKENVLLFNNKSFFKNDFIVRFLEECLVEKYNSTGVTFEEHYKLTNKTIIVSAYNLTKCTGTLFSRETTPNMSCVKAIQLSSNLPFIFETTTWNGDVYIDGGFWNNFPIHVALGEPGQILALTTLFGCYYNVNLRRPNLNVLMVNDYGASFYLNGTKQEKYLIFTKGTHAIQFPEKIARRRRNSV